MGCAFATAGSVVEQLQEHGLVREITGNERKRVYQNQPYVELFQKMTLIENEEVTP